MTVASPVAQRGKCLPAVQQTWVRSQVQEDPPEKEMATTPVLCLENSTDGRAWLATVHEVAELDFTFTFVSPVSRLD